MVLEPVADAALPIPCRVSPPEKPYKKAAPNRKNAEEYAPSKKYLRDAS